MGFVVCVGGDGDDSMWCVFPLASGRPAPLPLP